MKSKPLEIREGIFLFEGRLSRNLLFEPIVSNTYILDGGDALMIFDPSCGRAIGKQIEAYLNCRTGKGATVKRSTIIAGHSHIDHANNFYLGDVLGAEEQRVFVHESGFAGEDVMNEPRAFVHRKLMEMREYYNPYLSFFFPYNLLIYPLAAIDIVSPRLAAYIFSLVGGWPFPPPINGDAMPEPLVESNTQEIDIGGITVWGWPVDGKIVLPTPGHSPCSISMLWPEQKALFASDADWIGNPVFMDSSMRACISSLCTLRALAAADIIDLFLPAHGFPKQGNASILLHLDSRIKQLGAMEAEVLAYHSRYPEENILGLTRIMVDESPIFSLLKQLNYPRSVLFAHNIVALCLKENGRLDGVKKQSASYC